MCGLKGYGKHFRPTRGLPWEGRGSVRGELGSALVEFALAASIIFALFFGIIQFGFALYTYQFVNEVARELTRYAIVRGSSCALSSSMPNCGFTDSGSGSTLQAYGQTYTYPGIDVTQVTVTTTWYSPVKNADQTLSSWSACASGSGCNAPGDLVQVTVTYPFLLNIPFVPSTTLGVTSTSSMVISQ